MSYPLGLRNLIGLRQLSQTIRKWKPDLLVYLAAPRGIASVIRDACFFRASGVKRIVGLPWPPAHRRHLRDAEGEFYEPEYARLARCLSILGDAHLDEDPSWDIKLSPAERARAHDLLRNWPGKDRFIVCCVGTKVEVNDWGVQNWRKLLAKIGSDHPGIGLLLVGSPEEAVVSGQAAAGWRSSTLNLCGVASPRETAALLKRAALFLGHDSGPMQLAAAVGTRCVAVFSARNLPRIWFPRGENHRVVYHHMSCAGCGRERCEEFKKVCIASIGVNEVYEAVAASLVKAS